MDPVSPGDCPLLLVGFAQLWGHPLSDGPANWYSPDMPTTFEQCLPVTVSLIVTKYLPANSQFADEALRACQGIIESTFERVKYGFTIVMSYHMLCW